MLRARAEDRIAVDESWDDLRLWQSLGRHFLDQCLCLIAAAGQLTFEQLDQSRNRDLGRRSIGDVLSRKCLLMHLRAHVAGIDAVHAQLEMLGGEYRGELLECRLRRAVPAPTF